MRSRAPLAASVADFSLAMAAEKSVSSSIPAVSPSLFRSVFPAWCLPRPMKPKSPTGESRVLGSPFQAWAADVDVGIVEDKVFEMDERPFGPERGASLGEIRPRDPASMNRASLQPLVEAAQRVVSGREGEGGG